MKKIINYILVFVICLVFAINGVKAKSYFKELFQAGENIEVKEDLDGTAFLAGSKVTVDKNINGIGFIAGETVNLTGDQEYLLSAATTINVNGTVKNDAFIFGQDTVIKGTIERDLYIYSNSIKLDGIINRNSYLYTGVVEINGTINGNITINAIEINIDDNAIINGTLRYNEDAIINGLKEETSTKTYKINSSNLSLKDYIVSFINKYIYITLLAVVLVFIVEKVFVKSLEETKNPNVKKFAILCGKGFLILIGVPILLMMLIFSGVFVSVGIVGGLIYGMSIYISNIFTAYFIAKELDKKYIKKKLNSYLLMILGLLIINIISIIPILGALFSFISMLLGLGIIGNMLIQLKN